MQPFELPELPMPYAARVNPHLDQTRRHARDWAGEMGMLEGVGALPGCGVWDEAGFDAADFAAFAALTHPDAPARALEVAADWHICWWFFDDLFVELFKRRRDVTGARAFVSRLPAFMPADSDATPVPTNPVERGLADLWRRTAPGMPPPVRREFAAGAMAMAHAALWELANLVQNRLPDPVDYVEMRRRTGGADHSANVARYALGVDVPAEVFGSRPMVTVLDAFADIGPLRNDIFSYQKETEAEHEHSNGVVVVQRFLGCDLQRAVGVVNDLATARLRQFEQVVADELPPLFDELELAPQARAGVRRFIAVLQDWMAGDLAWSLTTGRYQVAQGAAVPTPLRLPQGPRGLGTSAARIASSRLRTPSGSGVAAAPAPGVPPAPRPGVPTLPRPGVPAAAGGVAGLS